MMFPDPVHPTLVGLNLLSTGQGPQVRFRLVFVPHLGFADRNGIASATHHVLRFRLTRTGNFLPLAARALPRASSIEISPRSANANSFDRCF